MQLRDNGNWSGGVPQPFQRFLLNTTNKKHLRHSLEKYANFICPQGTPQAKFQKFSEFSEFFRNLAPGVAPGYAAGLVANVLPYCDIRSVKKEGMTKKLLLAIT
ncbi:hypothetical protein T4D_4566 [Trichinella pseudospiralis]|uniref:Uncharacterized protein n=1 Tax=Trichinella pseudospiralis TaxID=6337 RepID=A0A0V1FT08_TRIPS|nr:hypothetical protein T4D_4566 [Trichinella pseudospiralis]